MDDEHYAVFFCPAHSVRPTPLGVVLWNFYKMAAITGNYR